MPATVESYFVEVMLSLDTLYIVPATVESYFVEVMLSLFVFA